jgi:hypothetical protein
VDKGKANTDVLMELSKKKKDACASDQQPKGQNAAPLAAAQTPPADGKKAQEPAKKNDNANVAPMLRLALRRNQAIFS